MHGGLERELRRLDQLGLLAEAEILVEVEFALLGTDPGALIVTSERILFLRTPLFRKTRVRSIPLEDVNDVVTSEGGFHGKDKGVLTIEQGDC